MGSIKVHTDLDCGCCGGAYLVVSKCESLSGTANLCGYSGYSSDAAPYDPGDPTAWEGQYRKWATKTFTGEATSLCCEGASGSPSYRAFAYRGSATYAEDCTFSSSVERKKPVSSSGDPCEVTAWDSWASYALEVIPPDNETGSPSDWTEAHTLTLHTFTGPDICSDTSSQIRHGVVSAELSAERKFYDSLASALASGGDVTSGHLCCATTSAADTTTPESEIPLSMSGTAVRVPVTVFGCGTPGADIDVFFKVVQDGVEVIIREPFRCLVPGYLYVPQPDPGDPEICAAAVALSGDGPWYPTSSE